MTSTLRSMLTLACLLAAFCTAAYAADQTGTTNDTPTPSLTATQIVERLMQENKKRAELLHHYEGCRHYSVDYHGFPSGKSADMTVATKFDAPASKEFQVVSEHGSQVLINHVFKKLLETEKEAAAKETQQQTALTADNYEFELLGQETVSGRPQYVLKVTPRTKNKFLYRGRVWIDAADFAVSRISAEPAKNPSFWISHTQIEHQYTKVCQFWLPKENQSVTKVRLGGTAKLVIQYSDYQVQGAEDLAKFSSCEAPPVATACLKQ